MGGLPITLSRKHFIGPPEFVSAIAVDTGGAGMSAAGTGVKCRERMVDVGCHRR